MADKSLKLEQQIQAAVQKDREKQYKEMVSQVKPGPPVLRNAIAAFGVGGFICALSQAILNLFLDLGLAPKEASSFLVLTMIFAGALLTGIGVYDNIGKFAGAGSIIPISGFANSIVSSAMEWKREGYVFGVAAKMFNIAGPVLVYGFLASWTIGLIYYLLL